VRASDSSTRHIEPSRLSGSRDVGIRDAIEANEPPRAYVRDCMHWFPWLGSFDFKLDARASTMFMLAALLT
jgi:hypothetical protein